VRCSSYLSLQAAHEASTERAQEELRKTALADEKLVAQMTRELKEISNVFFGSPEQKTLDKPAGSWVRVWKERGMESSPGLRK